MGELTKVGEKKFRGPLEEQKKANREISLEILKNAEAWILVTATELTENDAKIEVATMAPKGIAEDMVRAIQVGLYAHHAEEVKEA